MWAGNGLPTIKECRDAQKARNNQFSRAEKRSNRYTAGKAKTHAMYKLWGDWVYLYRERDKIMSGLQACLDSER